MKQEVYLITSLIEERGNHSRRSSSPLNLLFILHPGKKVMVFEGSSTTIIPEGSGEDIILYGNQSEDSNIFKNNMRIWRTLMVIWVTKLWNAIANLGVPMADSKKDYKSGIIEMEKADKLRMLEKKKNNNELK